jgi:signal peptidase I
MQPTISNQEILLIEPITEAPQVGDVLLYKTNTGRLIAHRVVLIIPNFRRTSLSRYLMQGDAVRTFDGWIQKHQILGNVVAKEINGSAVSLPKRSFVMLGPRLSKTFLFSLAVKIRRLIRGRSKK